jgi:putative transcriptional regulator
MKERYVYIKTYYDYGEVKLTLNQILGQKHIKPYRLSQLTGIKYDVLIKYVKGDLYRVDLNIMAKICFSLNCNLSDILVYKKNNKPIKNKYIEMR